MDEQTAILARRPVAAAAWQAGLEKLRPIPAHLDHGLTLHADALVFDNFGFLPMVWSGLLVARLQELLDKGVSGNDWQFRSSILRQTIAADDQAAADEFLDAIRLSGLSGLVQTVAEGKTRDEDFRRMGGFAHLLRALGDHVGHASTVAQAQKLREQSRLAVFWSCNGPPLPGALRDPDEEFALVDTWRHLGVRLMHLTYNRRNVVGDGCAEAANGGLSDLGRDLVKRLNAAGIVVDVPHSGEQTCLDAAAASGKPIAATHTGCRAMYEHIRTKSDRVLKAIADTGGVVGIVGIATFLGRSGDIHALLDHVDYAVKLIGADHVAIGTDTSYVTPWPDGLKGPAKTSYSGQWWGSWDPHRDHQSRPVGARDASLFWTNWPLFTVGLVQRGYRDDDIRKILGGNLLRVLRANETGIK
jgi:membrane dipeptidase